jgi:hypothetical protein
VLPDFVQTFHAILTYLKSLRQIFCLKEKCIDRTSSYSRKGSRFSLQQTGNPLYNTKHRTFLFNKRETHSTIQNTEHCPSSNGKPTVQYKTANIALQQTGNPLYNTKHRTLPFNKRETHSTIQNTEHFPSTNGKPTLQYKTPNISLQVLAKVSFQPHKNLFNESFHYIGAFENYTKN